MSIFATTIDAFSNMKTVLKTKPTILVTGFTPYHNAPVNPSAQLIHSLGDLDDEILDFDLETLLLPTTYEDSSTLLAAAILRYLPSVVISFGLARRANEIRLERIALNLDDDPYPDNHDIVRSGQVIRNGGPVAYWSTLDLQQLATTLAEAQIPVKISNHAGTYICNHAFYTARDLIEQRNLRTRMGLIHVPPLPEDLTNRPGRRGLAFSELKRAAKLILNHEGRVLGNEKRARK